MRRIFAVLFVAGLAAVPAFAGTLNVTGRAGLYTAGIEYRYLIADLSRTDLGSSTYNGYMTGTVSQSFNL